MMRAPYNFVPLSNEVFIPDWWKLITQDIPFENSISGSFKLKITAQSPVFVRNGHTQEESDKKADTYKQFNNINGKCFLPATSVKGAIRNVLEIISFGKMNRMTDNRYGIRDLRLNSYTAFFQNANIHCGWMTKNGDEITIADHGIPRRVSHKELDERFGTKFDWEFGSGFTKAKTSMIYKYRLWGNNPREICFVEKPLNPQNKVDKRLKVLITDSGSRGTIVFTGQPSKSNQKGGKLYEFVFPMKAEKTCKLNVEDQLYADFLFIYEDTLEWTYWKNKLKKGERIPVFFSVDSNGAILHLGLSYLYKLPTKERLKEYLPQEHKKPDLDLAECIFGTTGTNDDSLKGRVQFSNAFCTKEVKYEGELAPYMGSPRPTYYPIYVKQIGEKGDVTSSKYTTLLDENAELKGWKRYPIREEWKTEFDVPTGQENNTNPFRPLNEGSVFECTVRFHNLKREELGALLKAIKPKERLSHSIGFAKPFGYGRVNIEIEPLQGFATEDIETLKQEFDALIGSKIKGYDKSIQLQELYAMMQPQKLKRKLEYMKLQEFASLKKHNLNNGNHGQYLPGYTELIDRTSSPPPVVEVKGAIATIAVVSGGTRQLRIDGLGDKKYDYKTKTDKLKPKMGEKVEVSYTLVGGKPKNIIVEKKL
ncbi:TIGR03986 family CRISPR-associated RAMP protein [Bacteroides sp. OttesenSCG-928-E20]|nr:TIGR03986 family CRISPR-associated RAMP protein [Bacteroides sp. OttesenSCG-928-N06]MDL2299160.1 TIGR03986 family CRISPR-associated RAMP protein [Bacteroides sp. OttesenSCG-928-E20]MDL2304647.1 TIGR03986 family CRISPR-associated RAMP protein [Bacteroides sp. OttesenSCG-928-D19]